MREGAVERLSEALTGKHKRAAARDVVQYLQCFDDAGRPLFTREQISTLLEAVGRMAIQAAESGDDRTLKRMLDAQMKLAGVNAKLNELSAKDDELGKLVARLRDRAGAGSPN